MAPPSMPDERRELLQAGLMSALIQAILNEELDLECGLKDLAKITMFAANHFADLFDDNP